MFGMFDICIYTWKALSDIISIFNFYVWHFICLSYQILEKEIVHAAVLSSYTFV